MNLLLRICIVFSLTLFSTNLYSGTTGKIAGKITDSQTGEPLIGVNVVVVGTTLGAATGENGEYFILQVPPGQYSVRASMIGYQRVTKEKVDVFIGLTTQVDFELSSAIVELGKEVVVEAERPMVQKDITSSVRIVSQDQIRSIPNVQSFQDLIRIQPGVVGPNVRGGRGRETLYMIDGVQIANPVTGGYSGLTIPPDAISELQMITGGFNAEYGQAQSGVVNIVTREGSSGYAGSLIWRTDRTGIEHPDRNSDYVSFYASGPEPITSNIFRNIGIKLPGNLFFSVSGDLDLTDTYTPSNETFRDFDAFGVSLNGRQDNRYSANAKLTYRITPGHKLAISYRRSKHQYDPYNHLWKLYPDRTLDQSDLDDQWMLKWTHTLSARTFYTFTLSRLSHDHVANVNGMLPPDYPKRFEQVGDTDQDGFADSGVDQFWGESAMESWTSKFDLMSQVNSRHLLKVGVEWSDYHLSETSITYPGWYFAARDTISGKWPEYGAIRVAYNVFPNIGALYIQDKMEFEGLIVNIGLRYDLWMPGKRIEDRKFRGDWENRTGLEAKVQNVKGNLSPRLGISYPISERTVMYFAYGRFTQIPSLLHVYQDAYVGNLVGNPYTLNSEVTSSYEMGFNHQLTNTLAFELKGYLKDISGLIGLTRAGHFGLPVLLYVNKDYGTVRGFEFQIRKRYSNYFMGTLNYTLSWAKGRSSDPNQESSLLSVVPLPLRLRDFRLDWDQRHTVNLEFYVGAERNMHLNLLGLKLPDRWGISVLWRFGSGLPYTPPLRGGVIQPPYNTRTAPWSSTLDFRIEKTLSLMGTEITPFTEMTNALDRRNANKAFLNPATGESYKFGDTTVQTLDDPDFRIYTWEEIQALLNPLRIGPGRQVYIGLKLNW